MVYFALDILNKRVKIGCSTNIGQRIRKIGPGLKLLLIIDGSYDVEKSMHEKFKRLHISGEWFKLNNRLMSFIKLENRKLSEEREDTDENRIRLDFINRFNKRVPIPFSFKRQFTLPVKLDIQTL